MVAKNGRCRSTWRKGEEAVSSRFKTTILLAARLASQALGGATGIERGANRRRKTKEGQLTRLTILTGGQKFRHRVARRIDSQETRGDPATVVRIRTGEVEQVVDRCEVIGTGSRGSCTWSLFCRGLSRCRWFPSRQGRGPGCGDKMRGWDHS